MLSIRYEEVPKDTPIQIELLSDKDISTDLSEGPIFRMLVGKKKKKEGREGSGMQDWDSKRERDESKIVYTSYSSLPAHLNPNQSC